MLAYQYDLRAEWQALRSARDVLRMGRDLLSFFQGRLLRRRPLLKDPFAVLSLDWFIRRLNCKVIVLVRHPAAVASSLKRLKWSLNLKKNLLSQPLLVRDHLESLRPGIEQDSAQDLISRAAWLWRIIYSMSWQVVQKHPEALIVRHEDLARDPIGGFRMLYQASGLKFTSQVEKAILKSTSSENPTETNSAHSIRLNSRASLQSWKKRLNEEEIARIATITAEVWPYFYSQDEW